MSRAPALVLRQGDRERLAELARLPSVPSGLAKRARMVLLAADGMPNAQIARAAGVSRPTAGGTGTSRAGSLRWKMSRGLAGHRKSARRTSS
jgi:DNA-binding CsgD family transcriptional regulator